MDKLILKFKLEQVKIQNTYRIKTDTKNVQK